ncbi:PTS transporter subunit EIIB [Erwinia sp. PK3-005]|uniref:PTS transporter subunit EIIB n=1 Tax=Mixta hanseatica TaxID=2872648 RepID=A0ABY4RF39_9GAMM|nr:PTS transporter subunit EIIB [Mixta hanseatica]UQY45526.1 PTS transporter subunit EIIB [Mixta hanseatica]
MEMNQRAERLLQALGGADNLTQLVYCASRVRVQLRDDNLLDKKSVAEVEGVNAVVSVDKPHKTEYQLVIGPGKAKTFYQEIIAAGGLERLAADR